ncbi:uncharacterized protein LOC110045048 isoform X2 [Orbicella faveolata]|uniref:uncharacterized protein LOC110045048 isoform X2 n=1 Tax=Orbicella faveolata TaxID=48498 RepID=UPI0009E32D70|nr:uncharacterized protein LOC110045048 isoform X2 [Orbicella faveolata]
MAPPRVPPSRKKDDLKDDAATDDGDFFQFASLPLSIAIVILLIFYWFVCYDIDAIPLHVLGPFGQFVSYLASNHLKELRLGFRFTLMVHILEAGFAYRISSEIPKSFLVHFRSHPNPSGG